MLVNVVMIGFIFVIFLRSSPEASESRPQSVKAVNDINSEENPAPKTKVCIRLHFKL